MKRSDESDNQKDSLSASRESFGLPDYYTRLSEEQIHEFIILYEKHYGVVIDREVAIEKGTNLCRLIEMADFFPDFKNNKNEYEEE